MPIFTGSRIVMGRIGGGDAGIGPRRCVGTPSSKNDRTSSLVTRPWGPVGGTRLRSTFRSRATLRVAGVASGLSLK